MSLKSWNQDVCLQILNYTHAMKCMEEVYLGQLISKISSIMS